MTVLQQYQIWIGLGFAALLVVFLMAAFFKAPRMSQDQRAILRLLGSLCAGFAGALITGDALFKMSGKTTATEYAVSGTAGCALFFVVWVLFPKQKEEPPPPDSFSFSVPDGWTFRHVVDAIVSGENSVVEYSGFTKKELDAGLKSSGMTVKTPADALQMLRLMTLTPNTIRPYDVKYKDSVFHLAIRNWEHR